MTGCVRQSELTLVKTSRRRDASCNNASCNNTRDVVKDIAEIPIGTANPFSSREDELDFQMNRQRHYRKAGRMPITILVFVTIVGCSFVQKDDGNSLVDRRGCDGQEYQSVDETPYVLPFPVGKKYPMNLGNCSTSFHASTYPDRYAYDFGMEIGTLITAARAGTVVRVVESGRDYDSSINNLVVVSHGDGTFAEYMHLTNNGALVERDQVVEAGDEIGYSGATGLAGYPHLHFILVKDDPSWPYEPVPVTFGNAMPSDLKLREGITYEAEAW